MRSASHSEPLGTNPKPSNRQSKCNRINIGSLAKFPTVASSQARQPEMQEAWLVLQYVMLLHGWAKGHSSLAVWLLPQTEGAFGCVPRETQRASKGREVRWQRRCQGHLNGRSSPSPSPLQMGKVTEARRRGSQLERAVPIPIHFRG